MERIAISNMPLMDESEATGQVAQVFDDIKRELEMPFVTNILKAPGVSPNVLSGLWDAFRQISVQTSLPASLAGMINYSVSAANKCHYCNSLHTVVCKTIGIDDETLQALSSDLEALAPQRVQEIIRFAVKCGTDPQSLTESDYDRVRDQGVSDEEMMEIIALSAWATMADRIADSLKIKLDQPFAQALEG